MAEISIAYRNGMVVAKPLSDDDEDESPGRILTVEEFIDRLRNRTDIFGVDKNHRLRNLEVLTLLFALFAGFFVGQVKPIKVGTDFYMKKPVASGPAISIFKAPIDRNRPVQQAVPKPVAMNENGKHPIRPSKNTTGSQTARSESTGGGSIHARIARTGVLGILAGKIIGRDAPDGDILGKGGFAEGVDAILSGMHHGLKQGGSSVASRPGAQGIGFGPGYNSGYHGTGPGIDGMIDELMRPTESASPLALITGPPDRIKNAAVAITPTGVMLSGAGRSRVDIMRVVMQNLSALRYAYNQRLRDRPGLTGKITIKFAVDEFGNVIACEVMESSIADNQLETVIRGKILRWRFDRINKPGDITEVVYPFVFST
jgi:hypothetical protein